MRNNSTNRSASTPIHDKDPMITAVKAYALSHYESDGWDFIAECWRDRDIARTVHGSPSIEVAIRRVGDEARRYESRRQEGYETRSQEG